MSFEYRCRFSGSVSKVPGDADRNEDAFWWSPRRSAVAVSDGASESFDSKLWAQILVRLFVLNPVVSTARVNAAVTAFTRRHDPGSMSWSRQAAFDRGSFATLTGIAFDRSRGRAHVLAIGDTQAFLLDGARLVASFPYTDPAEFRCRPTLLSTRAQHNAFLDLPAFSAQACTEWQLDRLERPCIVCMTDALAEWFLRRAMADDRAGELVLAIAGDGDLEELVVGERESGRMQVDDSTLFVLE